MSPPHFIAADVGGTHARVALVRGDAAGGVAIVRYERYRCAEWAGLDAIVADFMASPPLRSAQDPSPDEAVGTDDARAASAVDGFLSPSHAVLACAGVVHGDVLINTNLPWNVSLAALRKRLALAQVDVINDFEALAHAVPTVTAAESRHLVGPDRTGRPVEAGTVVVMGPGTGLGCAAVLPEPSGRHRVLATEAGHISLAASSPREAAVVAFLAAQSPSPSHLQRQSGSHSHSHVPVERVISGPGLLHIYNALAAIDGVAARCATPSEVTAAATVRTDPTAVEAAELFCGWLGSFCADLAMLYGATGGVLLAGGFLPALDAVLRDGRFERRFLDKGVLAPWLQQVPVRLLAHGQLAVIGAARWSMARHAG